MADQDFNINVRTIADTTGIKLTEEGLRAIKIAALQGNKEAITALQNLTAASRQAQNEAKQSATQIGQILGSLTGIGIGTAIYQLVEGLKAASSEIEKIAEDLDKQGAALVQHAQLYGEEARHAKDVGDVLKLSDKTLKDIEATQKTLNDLTGKDLSNWAKFSDFVQQYVGNAQQGVYTQARQLEIETALAQLIQARQQGMKEVLEAEQRSKETLEDHINILVREILAQDKLKAAAKANNDPGGYVQATNNAARLRIELEKVIKLQEERDKAADKTASQKQAQEDSFIKGAIGGSSAQTKAVLANELAAQRERRAGDERSAELFEKSAAQLEKSMTPEERDELEGLRKATTKPVGRKAQIGESQELVDQIERNRINNERVQRGEKPLEEKGKDSGLIDAVRQAFDQSMAKYWGP